jgi:nucleoside-diphosphate-sugar epimerase
MILITGAAGLSGTAIVREFSRNGVAVRALVRDRSRAVAIAELPDVELVEGDMARAETLERVLDGIDRALMISSSDPQMDQTQCPFIDACKAAAVPHVVKFSGKESSIGFDASHFLFTRMHETIERYLSRHGTDRVARIVLVAPTTPFLLKTADNPFGLERAFFDNFIVGLEKDRPQALTIAAPTFFGSGSSVSQISRMGDDHHQAALPVEPRSVPFLEPQVRT